MSALDTNFIFSCSTGYLTCLLCSLVRYQVEHWMKHFITTRQHVISSMWQYASCILLWSAPFSIFHKLIKVDFFFSLFLCLEIFIFHIGNIVYLQSSRSCWWVNIFNKFHSRWWFAINPLSPTLNVKIFLTGILCICYQWYYSKWFEPRSISSSCSVIVRVSVVLKRTVGDSDWRFNNLSGRHLQSHCDNVLSVDGIYVSGYWPDWSIKLSCYWL